MTPQEIQELQDWCNEQPDYFAYKKECLERRIKFCEENNITLENLEKWFHKGIR